MLRCYSLGSPYGKTACEDFATGAKGVHIPNPNAPFICDPILVWGQLRGARELLSKSRDFYRMDHAYIGRKKYYRVTHRDFNPSRIVSRPSDRWQELKKRFNVSVREPRRDGKHILVCLHRQETMVFFGEKDWENRIGAMIKANTDRPVIMRGRESNKPIAEDLKNAHCVVHYASNAAIDAVLAGIPVVTLGPHITRPLSGSLETIDGIELPDRQRFLHHLAYCQFTPEEMKSGEAWRILNEEPQAIAA